MIPKRWNRSRLAITPPEVYYQRRRFLLQAGMASAGLLAGCNPLQDDSVEGDAGSGGGTGPGGSGEGTGDGNTSQVFTERWGREIERNTRFDPGRPLTEIQHPLTYNNFYEFTADKGGVHKLVGPFVTEPWQVRVDGLCNKPKTFDLDDLVHLAAIEERAYRFRCVEAWAMTVPWLGYPLSVLLNSVDPQAGATHVRFESFLAPQQAPGQKSPFYTWPYYEGLTLAEAMNELTLVTLGMYDQVLPKQNGAPVRVVVPWKYGYKGPKSVVHIELVDYQPATFWNDLAPNEYGFQSNVNPDVPHPRWSQKFERLLGEGDAKDVPTQLYNGYGEYVSGLYT